ncbi:MAG: hypothetical protein MZV64_22740 [Ignavibacteriales bacterium]|nr:hypothetical protein [Ignavibacteriales bacterium]
MMPGPLVVAHGRRAGIGQQVDRDLLGRDAEDVEAGLLEERLALPPRTSARSGSTILMRKGSIGRLDVGHRYPPSLPAGPDGASQNAVNLRNWRNRASTRPASSVSRSRSMPKSSMANEAMTLP